MGGPPGPSPAQGPGRAVTSALSQGRPEGARRTHRPECWCQCLSRGSCCLTESTGAASFPALVVHETETPRGPAPGQQPRWGAESRSVSSCGRTTEAAHVLTVGETWTEAQELFPRFPRGTDQQTPPPAHTHRLAYAKAMLPNQVRLLAPRHCRPARSPRAGHGSIAPALAVQAGALGPASSGRHVAQRKTVSLGGSVSNKVHTHVHTPLRL